MIFLENRVEGFSFYKIGPKFFLYKIYEFFYKTGYSSQQDFIYPWGRVKFMMKKRQSLISET